MSFFYAFIISLFGVAATGDDEATGSIDPDGYTATNDGGPDWDPNG